MNKKQSGIYLIYLGKFENLKFQFKILESPLCKYRTFNDEDGIYKFGKTKDLKQRINQHKNHYEKILGQRSIYENFKVISFREIIEDNLTQCENKVKSFCIDNNYHFIEESLINTKHNELVIIKPDDIPKILNFYENL
jgi:hypothetical protein